MKTSTSYSQTQNQLVYSFDKHYGLLPEQVEEVEALCKTFDMVKYAHFVQKMQNFAMNLRKVQSFIQSEKDETKRIRLQVHFGLIVIDNEFMVIQVNTLAKIIGSNSITNNFLKKMRCNKVEKPLAADKKQQTFLKKYGSLNRKWSTRYTHDFFNPEKKGVELEDGRILKLYKDGLYFETIKKDTNLVADHQTPTKIDVATQSVGKKNVGVQATFLFA